jgi:hypothetical protein
MGTPPRLPEGNQDAARAHEGRSSERTECPEAPGAGGNVVQPAGRTSFAMRPFGPSSTLNSTCCPSSSTR